MQGILNSLFDATKRYINSPAFKRVVLNTVRMALTNPGTRNEIARQFNTVYENVREITFRSQETEVVIRAAESIKSYQTGETKDSTIIQGEHIINNVSFSINIQINDLKHLKELQPQLQSYQERLSLLKQQRDKLLSEQQYPSSEVVTIDQEVSRLIREVIDILKRATDYEKLREALGTNNSIVPLQ